MPHITIYRHMYILPTTHAPGATHVSKPRAEKHVQNDKLLDHVSVHQLSHIYERPQIRRLIHRHKSLYSESLCSAFGSARTDVCVRVSVCGVSMPQDLGGPCDLVCVRFGMKTSHLSPTRLLGTSTRSPPMVCGEHPRPVRTYVPRTGVIF